MLSLGLALLAATATNVPLTAMTRENHALVQPVAEHHNLRRQYAARWFRGRPEHFEFLMDHMVACSVLAQALGLIAYRAAEETPGRLFADDGAGAQGYLQQVYRAPGKRIYFVEGTQRGRLSAWGRGVVVVRYAPCAPDAIEYSGSMYVKNDNRVAAALAEMCFMFVGGTVDRHFDHVMWQPITLSGLALDDPARLRHCIERMSAEDRQLLAPLLKTLPAR